MVVTEKGEVTVVEKAVGRAMEKAVVRNVGVHAVSTGQIPMDHDGKEIKRGESAFLKQPQYDTHISSIMENPLVDTWFQIEKVDNGCLSSYGTRAESREVLTSSNVRVRCEVFFVEKEFPI